MCAHAEDTHSPSECMHGCTDTRTHTCTHIHTHQDNEHGHQACQVSRCARQLRTLPAAQCLSPRSLPGMPAGNAHLIA
eukprot:1149420-Pelagomonas_calceolata.AAC.2